MKERASATLVGTRDEWMPDTVMGREMNLNGHGAGPAFQCVNPVAQARERLPH